MSQQAVAILSSCGRRSFGRTRFGQGGDGTGDAGPAPPSDLSSDPGQPSLSSDTQQSITHQQAVFRALTQGVARRPPPPTVAAPGGVPGPGSSPGGGPSADSPTAQPGAGLPPPPPPGAPAPTFPQEVLLEYEHNPLELLPAGLGLGGGAVLFALGLPIWGGAAILAGLLGSAAAPFLAGHVSPFNPG